MSDWIENENRRTRGKMSTAVNITLSVIIVILIMVIATLLFVLTPMTVSGDSMNPSFNDGNRVLVLKLGYTLQKGDVVVFSRPGSNKPPIKRIIGMPGDVITFDTLIMNYRINGEELTDYVEVTYSPNYFSPTEHDVFVALTTTGITVGEDEYFVLGDNRNNSQDSHVYGCIKQDWIKGKVILQY